MEDILSATEPIPNAFYYCENKAHEAHLTDNGQVLAFGFLLKPHKEMTEYQGFKESRNIMEVTQALEDVLL